MDELQVPASFLLALAATLILTPAAIRLAVRTAFYDHPVGYKEHGTPTPYLGGMAVVAAVFLAAGSIGGSFSTFAPIMAGCAVLWVVGTADDRFAVGPVERLVIEIGAATLLWAADLGWSVFESDAANLVITVAWVVGLINAFNLMDNMDGAASVIAAVSAAGITALALIDGDPALAALTIALCGACVGFLPFNLASPARIFLGDGGSMPVGFLVAAGTMAAAPTSAELKWAVLPAATLIVALPVLDTALVVVSRMRRRVVIYKGARDHLTHRLMMKLGSTRRVAVLLGLTQAVIAATAVALLQTERTTLLAVSISCYALGAVAIWYFETFAPAPAVQET